MIRKFKVGDEVRVIKNNFSEEYSYFNGQIGSVTDNKSYYYKVNFPQLDKLAACEEDELELVLKK